MGKVLGEQDFSGARDKDETEVGITLGYMRELRYKMLPNTTSTYDLFS
jgi:hypothetical protein